MLRGFSASPAVCACSQHVRDFTLSHLKHVTCSRYACIRPRPSWTSGSDSRDSPDPSLVWIHLHYLQQHFITCPPAVGYSSGPMPGCFSFFASIWHVFHPPHPMISMPTSPSESQLPIHPWNQLISDVTSVRNTQASRENRNHHARLECPLLCRCADLWLLHSVDDIGLPCRNPQHLMLTRQSFSRASL